MKKLLLLIIMILNLVLLQAQEVKFISVNEADTTLENVTFKQLPKLLGKDSLTADTLTTPVKWMVKLQKKLTKKQRQDSNIYIFFCPSETDSIKAFLPLSGKYAYVLFDTAKTGVVELARVQERLFTWKYQWDLIHDPENMMFAFLQEEEEGAAKCYGIFDDCEEVLAILAKIRDTRINGNNIVIKKQTDDNFRRFTGNNIDIEETEFKKVRIIYKPSKTDDIVFDPLNYTEVFKEQNLYADENGNGVVETHSGFVFKDENNIESFRVIIDDEGEHYQTKKEILEKYLFGDGKPGDPKQEKISTALDNMEQYLGNEYEQESGSLRTDMTEEGTEHMDCSEFMSRYLQQACGLTSVPAYTTAGMVDFIKQDNDYLEFIQGSDDKDFKDIQPGDVFLWRKDDGGGGHTGVVVSYNSTTDQVTVMEAIGNSGASEESLSKSLDGYCKGCIRTSVYTRNGKALAAHAGWKGYFRPIIK